MKGQANPKRRPAILRSFYKCFVISVTLFILAILSDMSIKVWNSPADTNTKTMNLIIIIFVMTGLLMLFFNAAPQVENVFNTMFGFEKE
jgi:hypothetical protein